ncbi:glutathione S-transferase, partial [Lecanoromycetidae sp. Uapishka_2]
MEAEQKAKVTLYWLEKSRSQRVLWLLEECKVEYELKTFKRMNMLAPPEFKEVFPLGKAPIVTIESANSQKPLVLAESGALMEYLIDHFGPHLAPEIYQKGKEGEVCGETEEWTRYRYFMHYAEGTLMPYLVFTIVFNSRSISQCRAVESKFLNPNLKANWEFLEHQISSSPNNGQYLCGSELTGADIIMSFPLGAAKGKCGFEQDKYPKLWAYVERLEKLEGFKKAVQKIIDVDGSYDPEI